MCCTSYLADLSLEAPFAWRQKTRARALGGCTWMAAVSRGPHSRVAQRKPRMTDFVKENCGVIRLVDFDYRSDCQLLRGTVVWQVGRRRCV